MTGAFTHSTLQSVQRVFFLGSHPALSAAELAACAERLRASVAWDLSRLPVALLVIGELPSSAEMQSLLGGTTMIGTLRATFDRLPNPAEILHVVPEVSVARQGKRIIGLSALPCPAEPEGRSGACPASAKAMAGLPASVIPLRPAGSAGREATARVRPDGVLELAPQIRALAMELKRSIGMKGTRVVFPPASRPDLSTAQLLHNKLPAHGTAIFFLVGSARVDLVTIEAIQDIEAYARRDRGRPHADPGRGMLPPKVAQILLNLSLVPPGGTVWDPFCGVGTIPMEGLLQGLKVIASDRLPTQAQRTEENLTWLAQHVADHRVPAISSSKSAPYRVFAHDMARGPFPLPPNSVDVIVTEGWLGPPRTSPPQPSETAATFATVSKILARLLSLGKAVLRPGGRVIIAVPAFRVKRRLVPFPLKTLKTGGFRLESLIQSGWQHEIFRESARGTLLYSRPDAIVLREIVRFRKVA